MTRELRYIGWWDGPDEPADRGWPDVCGFVAPGRDDVLAAYLRSGTVWAARTSLDLCQLCGRGLPTADLTDGVHFAWPQGLIHYVEEHGVHLPGDVTAVAANGPAEPVDPCWFGDAYLNTHAVSIDDGWWKGRRRDGEHLPGCRHNPKRVPWRLPNRADIWIDRVPPGDLALMVRLRRLLRADWPFTQLRAMIANQPFPAIAGGSPVELHQASELREYLFYDTPGGLLSVDVDG